MPSALEQVLAEYLRAVERGDKPNQAEWLAKYPEFAESLREFFANRDQMDRLAKPLDPSVPAYDKSTLIRVEAEQVGACIGPYTLVQKLGEGGMGEVWVAKQSEPVKRKVALKLIKRGMDSKDVLARFEQERQALAMMDHPNIAKVFDGGVVGEGTRGWRLGAREPQEGQPSLTASPQPLAPLHGQPYFVMELVNGLPLTKFCDEARLTPRQRMELFIPVCQAVQHAHQKGIVHRDLKPSNILVTMYDGQPVPKVIDFGVAKALGGKLTDESMATQFGAVVGTFEYMSPEQAGFSGQDIDTRADIYSLGVILYELLTGLRPIDGQRLRKAALTEMIRILQEEEPSKPSTRLSSDASLPSLAALRQTDPKRLTALLRGELDWVVMKCLEKSRDRRYETVNGLARDLQHYLADEPVEARPPSFKYRAGKFLRRHKGPVLAASLVLLVLIGGVIGTTWGFVREATQRKIAETNEGKANDAAIQERLAKEKAVAAAVEERKQRDRADANAKTARRHLYAAHLNIAKSAWDAGRTRQTEDVLSLYRPVAGQPSDAEDLRGFEWHYLDRLCHAELFTLSGHTERVSSVVFSPDGSKIASTSGDFRDTSKPGEVKVWDATSGRVLLTLRGHTLGISNVVFSPDGKRLASAGKDGTVKIWDASTGVKLFTIPAKFAMLHQVAFSPDGRRLATAGWNGFVLVHDASTGEELLSLSGHASHVNCLAFSPNGKLLATAGTDQVIKFWDAATGQSIRTLKGHTSPIYCVEFSPDGRQLVSAGLERIIRLWDVEHGTGSINLIGHTGAVMGLAISEDGQRLASGDTDGKVKVWRMTGGAALLTLQGHVSEITDVAFSPDGRRIASSSLDQTIRVWDSRTGQDLDSLRGHAGGISHVEFSPDGERLVSASGDETVKIWNVPTSQLLHSWSSNGIPMRAATFSPDGKRIAAGSGSDLLAGDVSVWDAATFQELLTLKGHSLAVNSLAFSHDGQRLVSGSNDGTAKIWDAIAGQATLELKGHGNYVNAVAIRPDGNQIATASYDQTIKLWNVTTGQETITLKGHTATVTSVAYFEDGQRLASSSHDGTIRLWMAASGREALVLRGHSGRVWCVAISPDGQRLASASDDRTIRIWDVVSGQELLTLRTSLGGAMWVAFSPDGNRLAAADGDQSIKLWDARPRTPELNVERQAMSLIRALRSKPITKPALLDAIQTDTTITEAVRQRAIPFANDSPD
jgi:WD40 repeat protein/serine/threonine protein kinase